MTRIKKYLFEMIVILFSFIYIIPAWMVLTNSLKTSVEANKYSLTLPSGWLFENYLIVFKEGDIPRAFFNSLFVGTVTVIVNVIFSSMASFYIARSNAKWANRGYYYFISGILIPGAQIPTFFMLKTIGLYNTYPGIMFVFLSYIISFSVFIYAGFIKAIPRQMDESAIVEGCSTGRMFFQIIFPLLRPATITIIVMCFLGIWNDITTWLYYVSPSKYGMSLMIYKFYGIYMNSWNLVFSDVVMTVIPVLLIYVVAQKYLIAGLTAGAVKG